MSENKTPLQQFFCAKPNDESWRLFLLLAPTPAQADGDPEAFWAATCADEIIASIHELDRSLAIKTPVSPHFGAALLKPLGPTGFEIAKESLNDIPTILSLMMERNLNRHDGRHDGSPWSGSCSKAEHAFATLSSFGFSAEETEALMTQAFVWTSLNFMATLSDDQRLFALSNLCQFEGASLKSNAIALELATGTLGSMFFQKSSIPNVTTFNHGAFFGRAIRGPEPRLLETISSILSGLDARWLLSGSPMDEASSHKISAMLAVQNEYAKAFAQTHAGHRNPFLGETSKITMVVEQAQIASAAARAPSANIPHGQDSSASALSNALEGGFGSRLAGKRPAEAPSDAKPGSAPRL